MKVLLAMSGGVDSCVAAHVLTGQGHDVTGITLVFHPDVTVARCNLKVCCDAQDTMDARAVCDAMGIEHVTLDLSREFDRRIIQPFIDGYRLGTTPNPCGWCNRFLKIGRLASILPEYGCDRLATGHYCRIVDGTLYRGLDHEKDQSYFLSMVRPEHLSRLMFPLGENTKSGTREMARELKLPVAAKRESQELCFTGGRSPADFIGEKLTERGGFIKHVSGRILGTHDGLSRYTIGQRRGLGISWSEPLYVVELDGPKRIVTVGERHHLEKRRVRVRSFNRLSTFEGEMQACIRYNQEPLPVESVAEEGDDKLTVLFRDPVAGIAPGQVLAAYCGDRVIGGGIIEDAS